MSNVRPLAGMEPSEFFPAFFGACVVIIFIAFGLKSSQRDRALEERQKEEESARKNEVERKIRDELSLIESAFALLPDSEAALRKLKSRYGWAEILASAGLSRLHLRLLRQIDFEPSVDLPNMQSKRHGAAEARVLRRANEIATPLDRDYGIESIFQEPTVATLRDLVDSSLVAVEPSIDTERRRYRASILSAGTFLLGLDAKLRDPNDGLPGSIALPLSAEARRQLERVSNAALRSPAA
jgi:hypothetical protein